MFQWLVKLFKRTKIYTNHEILFNLKEQGGYLYYDTEKGCFIHTISGVGE